MKSSPTTAKRQPSPRSVAASPSEIRKHYFLDQYVIIAGGRNLRPDAPSSQGEDHLTERPKSPAIEREPAIMELPGPDGKWAVKVIANKFPAVAPEWPRAYGFHELVVDTPEHNTEFSGLPIWHIELILEAYRRRSTSLYRVPGIEYVSVFKNDGHGAGSSLNHAHTQIMALPLVPPTIQAETEAAERYRTQHDGHCPWCVAIAWEEEQRVRIVYADAHIIAIAPYASTAGYEVWLLPRHHQRRLSDLSADETTSLATVLKLITSRLDSIQLSYNFTLQESLPGAEDHCYIRVLPRWSVWGGFELATGMITNTVPPEQAAIWYRGRNAVK